MSYRSRTLKDVDACLKPVVVGRHSLYISRDIAASSMKLSRCGW
jgi:hypothetical protein